MPKTSSKDQPTVARRAYRIAEFCSAYGVSRTTCYELMASGKLRYFLIGADRRIPVEAAEELEAKT